MRKKEEVEQQLKNIHFNLHGWGRSEARELPHILVPDEEVDEVVNGIYEGGFALLVATNFRVLLIDRKPLNYLTVEDLRFDMINEIDYSHRLFGAHISISTGSKNLKFRSYNQARLRKLITHVQNCMAQNKHKQSEHQQDQNYHLEKINQQLQAYLVEQHNQQQRLQDQLERRIQVESTATIPAARPELAGYTLSQGLPSQVQPTSTAKPKQVIDMAAQGSQMAELYAEGMEEVFGQQEESDHSLVAQAAANGIHKIKPLVSVAAHTLELTPVNIAYSKLPMALRNRKFGRPSFHAHSQAMLPNEQPVVPAQ